MARTNQGPAQEPCQERLDLAAQEVTALEASLRDARALRDTLVVQAIDAGLSVYRVAYMAKISPTRVTQILATPRG